MTLSYTSHRFMLLKEMVGREGGPYSRRYFAVIDSVFSIRIASTRYAFRRTVCQKSCNFFQETTIL